MEYHFRPIGKTCAATGKDLVPGTVCHSAVVERDGQLMRLDYSAEGWQGPPPDAIGSWKCLVPQPASTSVQALDPEALMRCFEQLSEDSNPSQDRFRYVLALLLLKKRRLKLEGTREDGDIVYLEVIGSQGEGPFEIPDQQLPPHEIEELQKSLNAQLVAEWT